jgi:AraC-like DNA-binding protein
METFNRQATSEERATRREQDTRAELIERISAIAREDIVVEPLPGMHLARAARPLEGIHGVYRTAFCAIAQGAKEVYIGDTVYRYDADHYLLATMELPAVSRILQATREKPYLSLRLDLDPALVGSVMVEAGMPVPRNQGDAKAIVVSGLSADLLDACMRLIRLVDAPAEARVLVPLVKREIVFRLLMGEQGNRLRYLPAFGGYPHSIGKALEMLRKEFDRPLRIEEIARELGMSPSGFHHHFKTVTDMSPLQFQKQLRLQQARRLMLGENLGAATAGYRVGYSDASHFSRDYRKHFGEPPARDVEHLRESGGPIPAASTV